MALGARNELRRKRFGCLKVGAQEVRGEIVHAHHQGQLPGSTSLYIRIFGGLSKGEHGRSLLVRNVER